MKRIILSAVLVALVLVMGIGKAAAQNPVKWSASAKMINDTEGIVTLTADIDKGWHVYGTKLPDVGPNPTQLFYAAKGVSFIGNVKMSPAPIKKMDEMFDAELSYWENRAQFTRRFKVTQAKDATITVTVKYMCCNDETCRPPVSEKLTVKVN